MTKAESSQRICRVKRWSVSRRPWVCSQHKNRHTHLSCVCLWQAHSGELSSPPFTSFLHLNTVYNEGFSRNESFKKKLELCLSVTGLVIRHTSLSSERDISAAVCISVAQQWSAPLSGQRAGALWSCVMSRK